MRFSDFLLVSDPQDLDFIVGYKEEQNIRINVLDLFTGQIIGSGTPGYLPVFTAANVIDNSVVFQHGTNIVIGGVNSLGYKLAVSGTLYSSNGVVINSTAVGADALTVVGGDGNIFIIPNDLGQSISSLRRIIHPPALLTTESATLGQLNAAISTLDGEIDILLALKVDKTSVGAVNGVASLDSGGKVPLSQIPDSIIGQVEYMGTWNAFTNTPTLNPLVPEQKGHYYVVSAAGVFGGKDYQIGDWIISNGVIWEKVDNTDAVTSVFGRIGAILALEGDYQAFYPRLSQAYDNPSFINSLAYSKITGVPPFLLENQTITLSGDVTGIGKTSIASTISNNVVSNEKLRDSLGTSVIGRAASSTGDPGDIQASTDGHVLLRSAGNLLFGLISSDSISSIDWSKITNTPTTLLGYGITNAYTKTEADNKFVPYTGANANVNLGSNNITANSFIKSGGTSAQFLKADGSVDLSQYVPTTRSVSSGVGLTGGGNLSSDVTLAFDTAYGDNRYAYRTRQLSINGLTFDLSADRTWNVGTLTSVGLSAPTGFSVSGSPVTTSGTLALAFAAGYSLPTNASQTNWDTAYNNRITSLTTTGTSGAATLVSHVLNIPQYQAQGNYITSLNGEATASGPGTASVTLNNSAVTGKVLTGLTVAGSSVLSTDSILTAFGKLQGQVNDLIGGLRYEGTWNASTNTPTITSGVGTDGEFYIVNVAGTTNIDGINDWNIGDWIVFHDTAWQKVDNTESVVSVNGFVGAITLTTSNISEGTNFYFTNGRARAAVSLTTTGNNGAATYNNGTGVFNIPQYTLTGLGGVPTTRSLNINGTNFDLSADRSWTVGDVRTDSSYSNPSWITLLAWSKISGTPTTLSGYGITDAVPSSRTITINGTTQDLSANRTFNVGTLTSVTASSPLFSSGGATPNITIQQASGSQNGFLSSTDWTTFNSKQNALTNPVTGTGTINTVPKFIGITSIGDSSIQDNTNEVNITKRLFLNTGGQSILLTPNLAGSSNRIESSGLPLELTTTGASISLRALTGNPQFILTSSLATFTVALNGASASFSGLITTTSTSLASGNFGGNSASWEGNSQYPTLFGSSADRWIMHINPHISYTQNGVNGFTGSMTGATIRFASNPAAASFWDIGVGTNGSGNDKLSIGRAGTNFLSVTNVGNLGIGTLTAGQKLQIGNGTETGNHYMRIFGAASDIYFGQTGSNLFGAGNGQVLVTDSTYTGPFAIGTLSSASLIFGTSSIEAMRIFSSRNVYIGTTPSSDNGARLQVNGSVAIVNSDARLRGGDVSGRLIIGNSDTTTYIVTNGSSNGNGINLITNSFISFNSGASYAEAMRITSSGNVGVGSSTGFNQLSSVETTLKIANSNVASLYLEVTGVRGYANFVSPAGNMLWYDYTAGADRMILFTTGNLRVGTGSDNGARLQVSGGNVTITNSGIVTSTITSTTNTGTALYNTVNNVGSTTEIGTWGSTRTGFGAIQPNNGYIYSGVDLAIGSTTNLKFSTGASNSTKLTIDSAGAATFSNSVTAGGGGSVKPQFIAYGGASLGAGMSFITDLSEISRRNWFIGTEENVAGDFVIKSSTAAGLNPQAGNTRLSILNNGNVGIGTASPAYKLSIKGASNYDGTISVDNSTTTGGGSFVIRQNGVNSGFISVVGTALGNSDRTLAYYGETGIGHRFFVNDGTTSLFLNSSGNVLIGTTTDGGYKLDVSGQIRSFSATPLVVSMTSNPSVDSVVAARWTSGVGMEMRYFPDFAQGFIDNTYPATSGQVFGDIYFRQNVGSQMTSRMMIQARTGFVGINIINPSATIHANGGTAMSSGWNRTAMLQATYPVLVYNSNGVKYAGLGYDFSAAFRIWVNASSEDVTTGLNALSISNNGTAAFSSDVTAARYYNPGGPYGTGQGNARNHFTQFNAGNAGLAGGWISGAFGDALGNRIVIGQYQGVAVIAGHTANLDNWASMALATGGGNVMIGTITDNGNKLRVNGTIFSDSSVTATSFFESSDASLKTLVADNYQAKGIDSVVAKLYIKNGKEELGYYAQDLQEVLPSAVSKGSNGLLNLSYREVHTAKIAYLEEKIKQLEKRYENN